LNIKRTFIDPILNPSAPLDTAGMFRRLLRTPIVFDCASSFLQTAFSRSPNPSKQCTEFPDPNIGRAHNYNAGVTIAKFPTYTRRSEELYQLASFALARIRQRKILLIGPRGIHELFMAWTYGFSWRNITGIDLYSTHPKIKVMNMETLEFGDESFDCIVIAHTLGYSNHPSKCIEGCARVLKPGGRLIFNSTFRKYDDTSDAAVWQGTTVTGSEISAILVAAGFNIFYHRSIDKICSTGEKQTNHNFSAFKHDPGCQPLDLLKLS
jgi:SAM-dependent methyltransferase